MFFYKLNFSMHYFRLPLHFLMTSPTSFWHPSQFYWLFCILHLYSIFGKSNPSPKERGERNINYDVILIDVTITIRIRSNKFCILLRLEGNSGFVGSYGRALIGYSSPSPTPSRLPVTFRPLTVKLKFFNQWMFSS